MELQSGIALLRQSELSHQLEYGVLAFGPKIQGEISVLITVNILWP